LEVAQSQVNRAYSPQLMEAQPETKRWLRLRWVVFVLCCGAFALAAPTLISNLLLGTSAARLRSLPLPLSAAQTEQLLADLSLAERLGPANPELLRTRAAVYRAANRPNLAITELEAAYRLLPSSLALQRELALAYEAAGQLAAARNLWAALGLNADGLVAKASTLLQAYQWAEAEAWYRRTLRLYPATREQILVPYALAAAGANSRQAPALLAEAQQSQGLMLLQPGQQLAGGELRWLTPTPEWGILLGTPLSVGGQDPRIGTLYWSGWAWAVVQLDTPGNYRVALNLRHSAPPPVEMAFGIDEPRSEGVRLERGDGSWETLSDSYTLSQGYHVVLLGFLNNGGEGTLDRDGAVAWLKIEQE
jgi:tetratricopeptide (TPR) repeat protein